MGKCKKNNDKVGSSECAVPNATSKDQKPTEEAVRDETQGEDVEQWDFVKVIDQAKEPCVCRTDGCEVKALVVWQSSLDPHGEDVWPLCEGCQEQDFGGWPEESMPSAAVKESEEGKGTSCLEGPETKPNESKANNTLTPADTEVESPEDVEQWDFVKVIDQAKDSCVCRTDSCGNNAVVIWQSSFDPKGEDVWQLCEECQEKDFGGWPEELTPAATTTDFNDKKLVAEDANPLEDATDTDGGWDLKRIIPKQEIIEFPIQCEDPGCNLLAAVVWVNNSNPGEKWRGCLDCQEKYYEGWPDNPEDFPVRHMTQEHKDFLLDQCSRYKKVKMPDFLETSPAKGTTTVIDIHSNTLVTPPPNAGILAKQQKKSGNAGDGKSSKITPGPTTQKKGGPPKFSKQQQELHAQWQAAAVQMAGPDARVVVDAEVAKQMIFKFLYDAFRPMSATQIYQGLKVIPKPILKVCLDDMAFCNESSAQFLDSEDEEDESKKKQAAKKTESASYSNSIAVKSGKSANSGLYYVNYNTAKNGDGLAREEKEKLVIDATAANLELDKLKQTVKAMQAATTKLLSEPTNEVAFANLEREEVALEQLQEDLVAARKLKVNEKHKQELKRRIDSMATTWRKRKRLCMDFLMAMEENTDGTCSIRKNLSGDGPIEIESDESAAKCAIEYAKNKKQRDGLLRKKLILANANKNHGVPPDDSFVAVKLDAKGCVERVFINSD